jgi:hypothetical protein
MRLHSCYFSKQNLETTVVDQGMLEMLFKGILLLAYVKIMVLPHDYMHPFIIVSNDNLPISSSKVRVLLLVTSITI